MTDRTKVTPEKRWQPAHPTVLSAANDLETASDVQVTSSLSLNKELEMVQSGQAKTAEERANARQLVEDCQYEGFETRVAVLKDGRVVTGFLIEQDPQSVTPRAPDGQSISLERSELEEFNKSGKSLKPEGQLNDLTEEQLRNLFA